MRVVPGAVARSAVLAGVGLLTLVAPLSFGSVVANAQGGSQGGAQAAPQGVPPAAQPAAPRPATSQGAAPQAAAQGASQITLDVDAPTAGANVVNGQSLDVGGWAGVTGAPGNGIVDVEAFLDGAPGSGTPVGRARLGVSRPDVASALRDPSLGNSGYDLQWVPRNVSEGPHTLYIVARSASGDTATQTVEVTGCGCGASGPRGSVSNPIVVGQPYPGIWEVDTGGPGLLIQRDFNPFPW